ncbi:MAG: hypothetical protein H7233_15020, partial [Pseudorhodobacter sp.]|nr:hypothetical protein [Frankiaceae bacterium]
MTAGSASNADSGDGLGEGDGDELGDGLGGVEADGTVESGAAAGGPVAVR